ncbi:hypothetical protein MGLY_10350 [Neomoorella glycerini]|uniref:Uncharacterized protein n=1 Tax=Neomoorella glycerini TaxID=55779 RepID=A0A6I5ZP64_9FIRM|nr:hypothetical protein [Moorella glycerini]QGP91693.1 hypothetical protein MGLY_10350 [Moorella glycerini]
MNVPPEIAPWFISVLLTILSAALGVVGYLLKDIRAGMKDNEKEQNERIELLKREMADFKANMPKEYVLRDDFVRAIAGLDHKLDRMAREVSIINSSLNKLIGTRGDGR